MTFSSSALYLVESLIAEYFGIRLVEMFLCAIRRSTWRARVEKLQMEGLSEFTVRRSCVHNRDLQTLCARELVTMWLATRVHQQDM